VIAALETADVELERRDAQNVIVTTSRTATLLR
jgi:hypothetical protein